MTIRPARAEEAEAFASLHVAAWKDAHAALAPAEATKALGFSSRLPLWHAYLADATQQVLVAEYDGALAGLVCFGPASQAELGSQAEIKHLYIAASARKLGLGKALLRAALVRIAPDGYAKATLAVVTGNTAARGFYKACGGLEIGVFTDAGPLWKSSNVIVEWDFKMVKTALLVIDVQEAFNERLVLGHKRNNPDAESNIARILQAFRRADIPVFHIHHASTDPNSLFTPDKTGFVVQAYASRRAGERLIVKNVNSAFIGTTLEAELRDAGINTLVITGATSNHCVETTTRMAGNLGFDAHVVRDAIWAFDQSGVDGEYLLAEDIHRMSLANLNGEFATITDTNTVLSQIK